MRLKWSTSRKGVDCGVVTAGMALVDLRSRQPVPLDTHTVGVAVAIPTFQVQTHGQRDFSTSLQTRGHEVLAAIFDENRGPCMQPFRAESRGQGRRMPPKSGVNSSGELAVLGVWE